MYVDYSKLMWARGFEIDFDNRLWFDLRFERVVVGRLVLNNSKNIMLYKRCLGVRVLWCETEALGRKYSFDVLRTMKVYRLFFLNKIKMMYFPFRSNSVVIFIINYVTFYLF